MVSHVNVCKHSLCWRNPIKLHINRLKATWQHVMLVFIIAFCLVLDNISTFITISKQEETLEIPEVE